ncbi:Aerobic respiration control sensor protein ArcB [Xylophilus ampelinus]|nr:Aerobic respiration control sensor protein ArcB [Xylophilus ampelinus]
MLSRVFNLFEQGAQDLNRPESGLGLGLALVRHLVELHGGEVEARSRGVPGEGSEFVVRLPRVERPENEATEIQPTLVLVVDDVEDSSETLALLIEIMGYSVVRASTGPEALAKIKSKRPALVLLDIGLPGLSGWEIAENVRLEMETSPMLVAVTGYGQGCAINGVMRPRLRAGDAQGTFGSKRRIRCDIAVRHAGLTRRLVPMACAAVPRVVSLTESGIELSSRWRVGAFLVG